MSCISRVFGTPIGLTSVYFTKILALETRVRAYHMALFAILIDRQIGTGYSIYHALIAKMEL